MQILSLTIASALATAPSHQAGGVTWLNRSPQGGVIEVLAVLDPDVGSLLAGSDHGGLYRRRAYGEAWTRVGATYGITSATCIGYPRNSAGNILVGGSDPTIWATSDGGETWKAHRFPRIDHVIGIEVHPSLPNTAYFAAEMRSTTPGTPDGGIFRTIDGGDTWVPLRGWPDNTPVAALAVGDGLPDIVYAATYSKALAQIQIWESRDRGETWRAQDQGFGGLWQLLCLRADPRTRGTIYAGTEYGLYVTNNGGSDWKVAGFPGIRVYDVFLGRANIYAATSAGMWVGNNEADRWQEITANLRGLPLTVSAAESGSSTVVHAGTFGGGVFELDAEGQTWRPILQGLTAAEVNTAVWDPGTPATLYAGGNGAIWKSTDRGRTWRQVWGGAESIAQMAIDIHSGKIYAVGVGLWLSTDGGQTWQRQPLGFLFPTTYSRRLVLSLSDPRVIYNLESGLVLKSEDGGLTWGGAMVGDNPNLPYNLLGDLAVGSEASKSMYCTKQGVGMFRSVDAGETWKHCEGDGLADPNINSISASTLGRDRVIAGTTSGVYETHDGGCSWTFLGLGGRDISYVAISWEDPTLLYAATYTGRSGTGGIFRSADGGVTWNLASKRLPRRHRDVSRITQSPSEPTRLLAVSFEGGLFISKGTSPR